MVTFASVHPTHTYDGYSYVDACRHVAAGGAAIVGLNCSRGPQTMKSVLTKIRGAVSCAVAAQPVPYRTSDTTPAFESLTLPNGTRAFPIQLESFACTRFEMADFARWAQSTGINYLGVCCGGGPHHVRAMAEALGRETVAGRYSPAIELHPILGNGTAQHDEMEGWVS
jgi:betaine-homocysteine S-methyltransferase